ncbi:MAG: sulfotransferase [Pseudomonadota bacterium]
MLPNVFIPGAPKCGTTALADYLSTHPAVFLGHIKEPNYWSSDMPFYARREGLTDEDAYLEIYARAPRTAQVAIDASTHYLFSDVAVARITARFPDARFIVCLRNQTQIAHAWHMQMVNAGYDTVADFYDAWQLVEQRKQGDAIPTSCPEPKLLDYGGIASVGHQLQRLMQHVERDRLHWVFLEDLKHDPRRCYLDVLSFLGLDDDGRVEFKPSNPAFQNRSGLASRLARSPRLRPYVNRLLATIGPTATQTVKSIAKRALYRPAKRLPVDAGLLDSMQARFAADNERLMALTGRSFNSAG